MLMKHIANVFPIVPKSLNYLVF